MKKTTWKIFYSLMMLCLFQWGYGQTAYRITTIAGTGVRGFAGDNGPATQAQFDFVRGATVDAQGNIYIVDANNNRIRKIDIATNTITSIAGSGSTGINTGGYGGDGGLATAAQLKFPGDVAVDAAGNVYIADTYNRRIRKVDATTGIITTIAGTGLGGYSGDGGLAINAQIGNFVTNMTIDDAGNLYFSDDERIRKIEATTGIITTIAGTGVAGFSGDGGLAINAQLDLPSDLDLDSEGNIYFSDLANYRLRKIDATTGIITTIAGTGVEGNSGDGSLAINAQLNRTFTVALDANNNIYLSTDDYKVRRIDATTGIIDRVAGNGFFGNAGDDGLATDARIGVLNGGIAITDQGTIYLVHNAYVRKLTRAVDVTILADKVSTLANSTVKVPIRAQAFTGFAGLQLQLQFPADKASLVDLTNINSKLDGFGATHYHEVSPGKINVLWTHPSATAANFANDEILFELQLNVSAVAGEVLAIDIADLTLIDAASEGLSSSAIAGSVTVINPPKVSGSFKTENGEFIHRVFAVLTPNNGIQELDDLSGSTQFLFEPTQLGGYTLSGRSSSLDLTNGVDVADLLTLRRHLLGVSLLNSPYKIIAGDLNFSDNLDVADVATMRKLILGQQTTLDKNWRFIPANHVFADPTNPFAQAFPESYTYANLNADQENQNFIGTKTGDLNQTTDPNQRTTTAPVDLMTTGSQVFIGETIRVPVNVAANYQQIAGLQGTFEFNQQVLKYKGVEAAGLALVDNQHLNVAKADQGMISFLYDHPLGTSDSFDNGEPLFYLVFEVVGKEGQQTSLQLTDANIPSLAYDTNLQQGAKLRLTAGLVEVIAPNVTIFPNPSKAFNVDFSITKSQSNVTTTFSNEQGKVLLQQNQVLSKGTHVLHLEPAVPAGIYFVTIKTDQYKITKRVNIQ